MELPVNVGECVIPEFLNEAILGLRQFRVVADKDVVRISLQRVPSCKRWIEVDMAVTVEGKASVWFFDANQPLYKAGVSQSALKLHLNRTKEQMSEAVLMMDLYMTQGIGALYQFPEVAELLKAAIKKTSDKLAKNGVSGARVPTPETIYKKE